MKRILPILCLGLLALTTALTAQPCIPVITTYNGFATNLIPVSGPDNDLLADDFRAVVRATDFVRSATSPCNQTLNYRIRKAGTGTGVPTTVDVSFDCSELGFQLLEIWAGDGAPENWGYTQTYVNIQDNSNLCDKDPQDFSLDCAENDVIGPNLLVLNGLTASVVPNNNGAAVVKVTAANLVSRKYDNCQTPVKLRIRKSGTGAGVPSTTFVTFDCAELGTQLVEIWGGDAHGNWSAVETYIIINDGNNACDNNAAAPGCNPDLTPPEMMLYNGFAVNITPSLSGITAKVSAKMFLRQRQDNCSAKLNFRISKSGTAATPPATTSVTYDCSELGTQIVDIWAIDEAGNWNRTETYVLIQDNDGSCGNSPKIAYPDWKPALAVPAAQSSLRHAEPVDGMAVWPNPTNGAFSLSGYLDQADFVQVELYNALGQQVRTLAARQWQEAGDVRFEFELGDLPGGLYRCALRTSTGVQSVSLIKN